MSKIIFGIVLGLVAATIWWSSQLDLAYDEGRDCGLVTSSDEICDRLKVLHPNVHQNFPMCMTLFEEARTYDFCSR